MGLAAIKSDGQNSWALRCNASSGNLQPTETYILCEDIEGINDGVHHYTSKDHSLEHISKSKVQSSSLLPSGSFLLTLSSIVWREAWKYGERSWRYTQLDCGHAIRALEISSYILGWNIEQVNINSDDLSSLFGFNKKERYTKEESEYPDVLFLVSKNKIQNIHEKLDINKLKLAFDEFQGKANYLSSSWHKWDILDEIENATHTKKIDTLSDIAKNYNRYETFESKTIVLKRRSAQQMNEHNTFITFKEFETMILSVSQSLNNKECAVNLVIFIHNVEKLKQGLYILIRNKNHTDDLKSELDANFLWNKIDMDIGQLYILKEGDFKNIAKTISCGQSIASNGSFSLAMLSQFDRQLELYGAHRYKELFWECGSIGQQLYLEATSLKLSATGIGCYLDDIFHDTLKLNSSKYQSLYHFTIGRALNDNRLTNHIPYTNIFNNKQ